MEYLYEFCDMEKSQYIREMELKGKSIRKPHADKMIRIINKHWKPIIQGMKES